MTSRILSCFVPKRVGDDGLAEKGAKQFLTIIDHIPAADPHSKPVSVALPLEQAISASKLDAEFLRDSTTLVVIGHGSAVYSAINSEAFFTFLRKFKVLQSTVFISCELDRGHLDQPGFEANVINLLVKGLGNRPKVYASKTDVDYSVIKSGSFVWFHTPMSHIIPARGTTVLRKDPTALDVQRSMDVFSGSA